MDLYTDEQLNGGPRARKEESAPSSAVKTLSNGVTPPSAAAPAREDVHVSTLNCQLTKTAPPEQQDSPTSVCVKEGRLPCEESPFAKDDPQARSQQVGAASAPLAGCGSAAASPLAVCDDASQSPKPMPFHQCCDLAQLDPQVLCLTCGVFHAAACREKDLCQKTHKCKPLGVCCSCGSTCTRKPLVLCRYCGSEYCRNCWYRNPLACTCGQTFDQSPV